MAMKLCIDEKDEERESEAQSVVRAKKRAGWGGGRGEGGVEGRALLRPRGSLSLALSLFIFFVDAKFHSHLNCHVSLCSGSFFEYQMSFEEF